MITGVTGNDKGFRSGELARLAGVSPDTIRYYERKGLLSKPIRTKAGYRLYDSQALMRVRVIRSALAVGFTIRDLAKIFAIRGSGGIPCEEVVRIAEEKLMELDRRMNQLRAARRDLRCCVKEWNEMLSHTQKGTHARLLERMKLVHRPSPLSPPGLTKNRRRKNV
jgi:MerR family Zn(II)-responsive transcriptional regulator of zntA